eukprot:TRINITY_DN1800_c0_g1_i1.p2 TRINITY_DN1800_c0_g1~~TRINITY_DN1800_c0_g1_i1.p2  ORF type:complete len:62 (-),score=2.92 TRINITY_DN1800_c0_g1_i1:102-287(-)
MSGNPAKLIRPHEVVKFPPLKHTRFRPEVHTFAILPDDECVGGLAHKNVRQRMDEISYNQD